MIKIVDQNHLGVVNYVVSTEAEIANLPKDGLESQCKNCVKERRRSRYQNIIYEIYCIQNYLFSK